MTFFAAMAFVATAHRDDHHDNHDHHDDHHDNHDPHRPEPRWVPVPLAEKDNHIQELGKSAVDTYNKQNRARLYFLHVIAAEKLVRAPGHYSYRLLIKALTPHRHHPEFYKSQVMEDAARHGKPPVLSFGYFVPAFNLH
ncbi:hypothetical protein EJ110_NYTH42356 [Nymphaea thermarum]|nr:hypothetical protein EJ110_NYTH42356 [Nymphaea thermarum]